MSRMIMWNVSGGSCNSAYSQMSNMTSLFLNYRHGIGV